MDNASEMAWSIRPKRDLGTMEKLNRLRPANGLGPGRADGVTAIELVEVKLFGVGCARVRPEKIRAIRVIAVNHAEQVVGCVLLMRKDETPQSASVRNFPVEPPADISGHALLPAFED